MTDRPSACEEGVWFYDVTRKLGLLWPGVHSTATGAENALYSQRTFLHISFSLVLSFRMNLKIIPSTGEILLISLMTFLRLSSIILYLLISEYLVRLYVYVDTDGCFWWMISTYHLVTFKAVQNNGAILRCSRAQAIYNRQALQEKALYI